MTLKQVLEKTKAVKALLADGDKAALYKYASKVPDGGTIVDIGTAWGGSAFIMALASKPKSTVFTIDPNDNEEFQSARKELDLVGKVTFINQKSEYAYGYFDGWELDMIFEDGVHSYDGVKDDWETFGTKLKKGGIMAFHDYHLYDGIKAYVDEIVEKGEIKKVELVEDKYQDEVLTGLFVGEKL